MMVIETDMMYHEMLQYILYPFGKSFRIAWTITKDHDVQLNISEG